MATTGRLVIFGCLATLISAQGAMAQTYKCTGTGGKVEFRDKPCAGGSAEKIIQLPAGPSDEDQLRARQRAAQMGAEVDQIESEREAAMLRQQQEQARVAPAYPPHAAPEGNAETVEDCLRELESRSLTYERRSELLAACQNLPSAVTVVRAGVANCIRNVERQGLSGKEKQRRIAACRGVSFPLPAPKPQPRTLELPAKKL